MRKLIRMNLEKLINLSIRLYFFSTVEQIRKSIGWAVIDL